MPHFDVHMEVCYGCSEGGDLVCCDGCTAAYHLGCVNMDAVPQVRAVARAAAWVLA